LAQAALPQIAAAAVANAMAALRLVLLFIPLSR
jgi:hypothetical protein